MELTTLVEQAHQRRAELTEKIDALLARAQADGNRDLTTDEARQFEQDAAEIERLDAQIDHETAKDRRLAKVAGANAAVEGFRSRPGEFTVLSDEPSWAFLFARFDCFVARGGPAPRRRPCPGADAGAPA